MFKGEQEIEGEERQLPLERKSRQTWLGGEEYGQQQHEQLNPSQITTTGQESKLVSDPEEDEEDVEYEILIFFPDTNELRRLNIGRGGQQEDEKEEEVDEDETRRGWEGAKFDQRNEEEIRGAGRSWRRSVSPSRQYRQRYPGRYIYQPQQPRQSSNY